MIDKTHSKQLQHPANSNVHFLSLRKLVTTALKTLPKAHSRHNDEIKTLFNQLLDASEVINIPFTQFVLDSRKLGEALSPDLKSVFVLLKSHTQSIDNIKQYAKEASKHAAFIISEIDESQLNLTHEIDDYACPVLCITNLRSILGTLIQLSLMPENELASLTSYEDLIKSFAKVVAITGTNGKTTISQLVAQLCQISNHPNLQNSAVMGTAGNGRLNNLVQAIHTTGDVLAVQKFLKQISDEGVDVLALEASSHGLDQLRLQGMPIQVAIYTNLSRDHLDYHPDMQHYARAKAKLFDKTRYPSLTHAIINIDDEFGRLMTDKALATGVIVWSYSLNPDSQATFVAKQIRPRLDGVEIEVESSFGTVALNSPLLGRFNVANLLAAIAGAIALGIRLDEMPKLVKELQGAGGRMQRVQPYNADICKQKGCFIVDYAHTPDALTQVLTSLKPHCEGKLWAVFGCGGDRDKGKRPLMAQAGLKLADKVILTSDNPRTEDPMLILNDMTQGMSESQRAKTQIIADRREAINLAVKQAGDDDIVVIAGKGHETYQEINGVRHDFDDRQVLQEAFASIC